MIDFTELQEMGEDLGLVARGQDIFQKDPHFVTMAALVEIWKRLRALEQPVSDDE